MSSEIESLEHWARRQQAARVVAQGPREQPNRPELQAPAAQRAREAALRELYIELEAILDEGYALKGPEPSPPAQNAAAAKASPATPWSPALGGPLLFSRRRAPAVLPPGMVERRRTPRPA